MQKHFARCTLGAVDGISLCSACRRRHSPNEQVPYGMVEIEMEKEPDLSSIGGTADLDVRSEVDLEAGENVEPEDPPRRDADVDVDEADFEGPKLYLIIISVILFAICLGVFGFYCYRVLLGEPRLRRVL
ncbi:hypothetical protein L596_028100 [Steinernema carpocapsae]|uniref:Uncharacterized protein n=1 Tax=Steinernema carpocapsae TaxID=34508 RepID=A0A4U5LXF8_STECR|nr:hypothetical protein L596_028100 [Steinernema carpocapsae]